jgi:hypothetical protein
LFWAEFLDGIYGFRENIRAHIVSVSFQKAYDPLFLPKTEHTEARGLETHLTGHAFHFDAVGYSRGVDLERCRRKARHAKLAVKYLKSNNRFASLCRHNEFSTSAAVSKTARGEAFHGKGP